MKCQCDLVVSRKYGVEDLYEGEDLDEGKIVVRVDLDIPDECFDPVKVQVKVTPKDLELQGTGEAQPTVVDMEELAGKIVKKVQEHIDREIAEVSKSKPIWKWW